MSPSLGEPGRYIVRGLPAVTMPNHAEFFRALDNREPITLPPGVTVEYLPPRGRVLTYGWDPYDWTHERPDAAPLAGIAAAGLT